VVTGEHGGADNRGERMTEAGCDLVVRGGTVVTAGGSGPGDVGITGGKIVQLGGPLRGRAQRDAGW
jgi:hypothetical protein